MKKKISFFDKYMMAATFAEANLPEVARECINNEVESGKPSQNKEIESAHSRPDLDPKILHAR